MNAVAEKPIAGKSVAQQVLAIVQQDPGIGYQEIAHMLPSAKPQTIQTALHDLEKSGKIERPKIDGARRCYPAGIPQPEATGKVKPQPDPIAPAAKSDSEDAQPPQPDSATLFRDAGTIWNTGEDAQPLHPVSATAAITLENHLAAVASALPSGVILGVHREDDGKIEFTLDTSSGANFNMGESLAAVVNGINALAALQPFAEL